MILARWLATDPEFLILDEPTRGIDVGTKTEIQKLVKALQSPEVKEYIDKNLKGAVVAAF